jgi:hypothetical protein
LPVTAKNVPCPFCRVRNGQPCTTKGGRALGLLWKSPRVALMHVARIKKAPEWNLLVRSGYPSSRNRIPPTHVAQFIYLLLNNERIRNVIDTITSKVVLILGCFTEDRKRLLDAIRDELCKRDYLPILFDFEKPSSAGKRPPPDFEAQKTCRIMACNQTTVPAHQTVASDLSIRCPSCAPPSSVCCRPNTRVGARETAAVASECSRSKQPSPR